MTTLLPPAPDRPTGTPGTVAATGPVELPEQHGPSRLARLAAATAAAAGLTSMPFGAPVSPMAITRLLHHRPEGPAR